MFFVILGIVAIVLGVTGVVLNLQHVRDQPLTTVPGLICGLIAIILGSYLVATGV